MLEISIIEKHTSLLQLTISYRNYQNMNIIDPGIPSVAK